MVKVILLGISIIVVWVLALLFKSKLKYSVFSGDDSMLKMPVILAITYTIFAVIAYFKYFK